MAESREDTPSNPWQTETDDDDMDFEVSLRLASVRFWAMLCGSILAICGGVGERYADLDVASDRVRRIGLFAYGGD